MAVYVDDAVWPCRGKQWAHLMADSLDELHEFAQRLGLRRNWFQDRASGAHYDITDAKREMALRIGAVPLSRDDVKLYQAVLQNARRQASILRGSRP
ncbi:DUF4031 domain-containing protein [Xanthomonas oryzae]|uniref:DUF4031 domain-containing protein n=1 Tax=Xanthomonas oryzae TaxID=347 RepID=UPI003D362D04